MRRKSRRRGTKVNPKNENRNTNFPILFPGSCRQEPGNEEIESEKVFFGILKLRFVSYFDFCSSDLERMLNPEPELHRAVGVDRLGDVEAQHGAFDEAEPGDVHTKPGADGVSGIAQLSAM